MLLVYDWFLGFFFFFNMQVLVLWETSIFKLHLY